MRVEYVCPECKATLMALTTLEGKTAPCPKCRALIGRWPAPLKRTTATIPRPTVGAAAATTAIPRPVRPAAVVTASVVAPPPVTPVTPVTPPAAADAVAPVLLTPVEEKPAEAAKESPDGPKSDRPRRRPAAPPPEADGRADGRADTRAAPRAGTRPAANDRPPRVRPPAPGGGSKVLAGIGMAAWGVLFVAVLCGGVLFATEVGQVRSAPEQAAFGVTFSTGFIGLYVLVRCFEKFLDGIDRVRAK
jgi:hypothetical protein